MRDRGRRAAISARRVSAYRIAACAGVVDHANMTSCRNGRTVSVVQSDGLWRVRITWGNGSKNHIGKFATKQEAEKWIADHRLLTERPVEEPPPSSKRKP